MFTGIIQDVGHIARIEERGGDVRLTVATTKLDVNAMKSGDSVAVNGACLTALDLSTDGDGTHRFSADVSRETLQVTSLGQAKVGSAVNLESAMTLSDGLHGHLVSGHVDATGAIRDLRNDGRSWRYTIELPVSLRRFVAAKGSITVDGVSLTVNEVSNDDFGVNIIPHTYEQTIFKHYQLNTRVNLEIDLVARYTARLLECAP